jgi:DNA-binding NtrC family response regulator
MTLLFFTDLIMPEGISGLVLAEQARITHPHIAVLLTTAYTDELTAAGPKAPAMDVLSKPYRLTELANSVRAAINRHGAGHNLRQAR